MFYYINKHNVMLQFKLRQGFYILALKQACFYSRHEHKLSTLPCLSNLGLVVNFLFRVKGQYFIFDKIKLSINISFYTWSTGSESQLWNPVRR